MRVARQIFWASIAAASVNLSRPALAEDVYDGMTFAQLKAILTSTSLNLTEKVTDKGNPYFEVAVPGGKISFLATMTSCPAQRDAACDGVSYLYIQAERPMDLAAMGQFNRQMRFVKARPAPNNASGTVIAGEFYARGVTAGYVRNAGAYFTGVVDTVMNPSSVTSMNGETASPVVSFANATPPEKFLSEFAMKGGPKPIAVGAKASPIEQAVIDAVSARR